MIAGRATYRGILLQVPKVDHIGMQNKKAFVETLSTEIDPRDKPPPVFCRSSHLILQDKDVGGRLTYFFGLHCISS